MWRGLLAKKEFNARASVVAGEEAPYEYSIIVCGMRMFLADFSLYYKVGRWGRKGLGGATSHR